MLRKGRIVYLDIYTVWCITKCQVTLSWCKHLYW